MRSTVLRTQNQKATGIRFDALIRKRSSKLKMFFKYFFTHHKFFSIVTF